MNEKAVLLKKGLLIALVCLANAWAGLSYAVDTDNDGSPDSEENLAGTDINDATERPWWWLTFNNNTYEFYQSTHSVDGAGDVNNDGYDDVIIGGNDNVRVISGVDGSELYVFAASNVVSGAGDVNNDGYDDVIYRDSGGAVVASGADGSGLYFVIFGERFSDAGDVNNDGYADLIVSDPKDNTNGYHSGLVKVISGYDGADIYTYLGGDEHHLGISVSAAGDVNNDGYDDVIIGASDMYGQAHTNYAKVISGIDGSELYTFDETKEGVLFGYAVSGAGDVNNDGYDDVIVGAALNRDSLSEPHYARVYSGIDGSVLFTLTGRFPDGLGSSVSDVGDINGDGYDDLLVGAYLNNRYEYNGGSAHIYSGFDGALLYSFYGDQSSKHFGGTVNAAGDLDNDGYTDIIIGASSYARIILAQDLHNNDDADFIINGFDTDNDGDGIEDSWELANGLNPLDPDDAEEDIDNNGWNNLWEYQQGINIALHEDTDSDGSSDEEESYAGTDIYDAGQRPHWWKTFNGEYQDLAGLSVGGAGDINNDGYDDVLVGANGDKTPNGDYSGSVTVYSGLDGSMLYQFYGDNELDRFGDSVASAGDVDNDGYPDIIAGARIGVNGIYTGGYAKIFSGYDGTVIHFLHDFGTWRGYGASVDGVGDIDNDGYDDVIVAGSWDTSEWPLTKDRAYVYSGSDASLIYFFQLTAYENTDTFWGLSVSGAGDVNNDGYNDIIIGAYHDRSHGYNSGIAKVYSGLDGSELYHFESTVAGDHFGISVSEAGDVNNDGYADVIIGAHRADIGSDNSGSAYIYSGLDGSLIYQFNGDEGQDLLGWRVDGLGDIDSDNYDDVLVSAGSGYVKVFSGIDGRELFQMRDDSVIGFGYALGNAGDLDNDGLSDVIVGMPEAGVNGRISGMARVYLMTDLHNDVDADFLVNSVDIDDDNDSLEDTIEVLIGTDPLSADTDNDGLNDDGEDSDGDSLPNIVEINKGLDPANSADGTLPLNDSYRGRYLSSQKQGL